MPEVASVGTHTYLFADDTKAFRGIFQQPDCGHGQMDMHALQEWSDKWLLCFHPEKCKAMKIGKSRINKMDYTFKDGLQPMEYA